MTFFLCPPSDLFETEFIASSGNIEYAGRTDAKCEPAIQATYNLQPGTLGQLGINL